MNGIADFIIIAIVSYLTAVAFTLLYTIILALVYNLFKFQWAKVAGYVCLILLRFLLHLK